MWRELCVTKGRKSLLNISNNGISQIISTRGAFNYHVFDFVIGDYLRVSSQNLFISKNSPRADNRKSVVYVGVTFL